MADVLDSDTCPPFLQFSSSLSPDTQEEEALNSDVPSSVSVKHMVESHPSLAQTQDFSKVNTDDLLQLTFVETDSDFDISRPTIDGSTNNTTLNVAAKSYNQDSDGNKDLLQVTFVENIADLQISGTAMDGSTKTPDFVGKNQLDKDSCNAGIDAKGSNCEEMVEIDPQGTKGVGRCSLKIQVIDDTVLIESFFVPESANSRGNGARFMTSAKETEKKGNKNAGQEVYEKKANQSRKRWKDMKKVWHTCRKKGDEPKRMYSRKEMLALRFENIVEQKNLWKMICNGLRLVVVKEYNELVSSKNQKTILLSCDPRQHFVKKKLVTGILSGCRKEKRDAFEYVYALKSSIKESPKALSATCLT